MISFFRNASTISNAPGTPDLESLNDLGSSSTDNFTSDIQPKILVSCISGYTVHLYDGTSLIGTAPCVASTAQIVPAQPFSSGTHTLSATQNNGPLTPVTSGTLALTIDTAPLTVSITKASEQTDPATT